VPSRGIMGTVGTSVHIGGASMALSILLSIFLIAQHSRYYATPLEQQLIILIILMVPIFAINSFVGLFCLYETKFSRIENGEWIDTVLDGIKECWEAITIWAFLRLMFAYMKVTPGRPVPPQLKGKHLHQMAPFSWFMEDPTFDQATATRMTGWTMQFVYLRPVLTALTLLAQFYGVYEETWAWLPICIAANVSITLAVNALILFYHAFAEELDKDNQHPLAKFLCIKGVVFFAFWQGIVLQVLVGCGVLNPGKWFTAAQKSTAIQDMLVCIEMGLLFAPLHIYAFSVSDYRAKIKKD